MHHLLLFWKWIILIGPSFLFYLENVIFIGIDVDFLTQILTFQTKLHGFTRIYMGSKSKSFTLKQFYSNLNEFTQFYTYMSIVKHSHLH